DVLSQALEAERELRVRLLLLFHVLREARPDFRDLFNALLARLVEPSKERLAFGGRRRRIGGKRNGRGFGFRRRARGGRRSGSRRRRRRERGLRRARGRARLGDDLLLGL